MNPFRRAPVDTAPDTHLPPRKELTPDRIPRKAQALRGLVPPDVLVIAVEIHNTVADPRTGDPYGSGDHSRQCEQAFRAAWTSAQEDAAATALPHDEAYREAAGVALAATTDAAQIAARTDGVADRAVVGPRVPPSRVARPLRHTGRHAALARARERRGNLRHGQRAIGRGVIIAGTVVYGLLDLFLLYVPILNLDFVVDTVGDLLRWTIGLVLAAAQALALDQALARHAHAERVATDLRDGIDDFNAVAHQQVGTTPPTPADLETARQAAAPGTARSRRGRRPHRGHGGLAGRVARPTGRSHCRRGRAVRRCSGSGARTAPARAGRAALPRECSRRPTAGRLSHRRGDRSHATVGIRGGGGSVCGRIRRAGSGRPSTGLAATRHAPPWRARTGTPSNVPPFLLGVDRPPVPRDDECFARPLPIRGDAEATSGTARAALADVAAWLHQTDGSATQRAELRADGRPTGEVELGAWDGTALTGHRAVVRGPRVDKPTPPREPCWISFGARRRTDRRRRHRSVEFHGAAFLRSPGHRGHDRCRMIDFPDSRSLDVRQVWHMPQLTSHAPKDNHHTPTH